MGCNCCSRCNPAKCGNTVDPSRLEGCTPRNSLYVCFVHTALRIGAAPATVTVTHYPCRPCGPCGPCCPCDWQCNLQRQLALSKMSAAAKEHNSPNGTSSSCNFAISVGTPHTCHSQCQGTSRITLDDPCWNMGGGFWLEVCRMNSACPRGHAAKYNIQPNTVRYKM